VRQLYCCTREYPTFSLSKKEMSVDGKAFRKAIRQERFGDDDAEKVYKKACDNSKFDACLQTFLQHVNGLLAANVKMEIDSEQNGFILLNVVSSYDEGAEDFGEQPETLQKKESHSFVDRTTGNVYLPSLDGTVPNLLYGARCNVNDQESYSHALQSKGFMAPFKGGARILLELGVDIDSSDTWGETALMYACACLNEKTINWLLTHGASPNCVTKGSKSSSIHRVVEAEGPDEVKQRLVSLLLKHKGEVNLQNAWGVTPLQIASLLGLPETCKLLTNGRASKDLKDVH